MHNNAFYNIENLFDTINNPNTADNDFLPTASKRWTKKRYHNKLEKIGKIISMIGLDTCDTPPVIIGLAEVENKMVLEDLLHSKHLVNKSYNYVHFDSLDERGIDVALLYNPNLFKVTHTETFAVYLENDNNERDFTRDILLVSGVLENEAIHVLVNHWSSRREGIEVTEGKRIEAANTVNSIISKVNNQYPDAKFIVMGDFNDNPTNASLVLLENESKLFNPFKNLLTNTEGSLNHKFEWLLFDQILISYNFLPIYNNGLIFKSAAIFNDKILTKYHGKNKGQPFRTYLGNKYLGGYSDHFPVYVTLAYKNNGS